MRHIRLRRLLAPLAPLAAGAAGMVMAGCVDLDVTNPNQRSTATFWRTQADAIAGTNAVYAGLLPLGVYSRWQGFVNDLRSDIATSTSPNPDIRALGRFSIANYDEEHNFETYRDHYRAIFRANQAIANIPNIEMDLALRDRLVGESKFIRALLYFNLVNYYGGNIPLVLAPTYDPATRVASSTVAAIYAQIEQDLGDAIPALPVSYGPEDIGRVTKGAAQTLLGKVYLQQLKYPQASAMLDQVIASAQYELVPNYGDNFVGGAAQNNAESIFEVQLGDESTLSSNIPGFSLGTFVAPCGGPGFCDVQPTKWFYQQFLLEPAVGGGPDKRLDVSLFYYKPGDNELVWTRTYSSLWNNYSQDTVWFRKYTEWYNHTSGFNRFDAPINFRVLRFADVLLMQAEALTEQSQVAGAKPYVDSVRVRAGLDTLPAGMSQGAMRDEIRHQRLLELGLEAQRWFDLVRWGMLDDQASIDVLKTHDADFDAFVIGKSKVLPIPVAETNLNPLVNQNPGY